MKKQLKKTLSLILSLMMIMSMFAGLDIISFADDILCYLEYEINNGEVTITDCDESISGDVVIPDTIEGYPVRVIKNGAFMNCKKLVSVAIGDNVTVLNEGSFAECDNLESVTFGKSVKEIGYCAFGYCDKLDNIILPDSLVKIGNTAFLACTSLNNIKINDGVESIGMHAFSGCTSLTKLIIPTSVNNISFFAFGYTDFSNGTETMLRDDSCTIHGVPGSAAEAYANENGIAFVAIEPEEPPVEEPPVEEPPVEEPPVEEPPVEEPPVEEPPEEEPPVEEPSDNGQLEVKGDGGITIDFEKNIVQIGKEVSHIDLASMIANQRFGVLDKNLEALGEADLVGTGSKILILDKDGNIANEYTVVVPTDIDGNGKTTAADARLALRTSAQLESLDGVYFEAADVTGDGKITASDARKILRISAGLEK